MQYRIGLDVRMMQNTGIGTYLRGLLGGFEKEGFLPRKDFLFLVREKDPRLESLGNARQFFSPIYSVQEQFEYPFLTRHCRLWHSPHYNIPLVKGKTKLVVTIHDIIHWVFRAQFLSPLKAFYAGGMLTWAVKSSDHIIAVSQHTKKDLMAQFGAEEKKITVIPEGVRENFHEIAPDLLRPAFQQVQKKYNVPDRFFLYVGLMKPHKNVLWLLRLFRQLRAEGKVQSMLVLVGRKDSQYPKGYQELALLASDQDVIHLPRVENDELLTLYNQAQALVHPSLYEGFGLTPLEAMACGTPVITTNAASIPEVVGDAAVRVDVVTEDPMRQALIRMEEDAVLRESYRLKGLERVKLFTWRDMARKTAAVYEKVLAEVP